MCLIKSKQLKYLSTLRLRVHNVTKTLQDIQLAILNDECQGNLNLYKELIARQN